MSRGRGSRGGVENEEEEECRSVYRKNGYDCERMEVFRQGLEAQGGVQTREGGVNLSTKFDEFLGGSHPF